ncbi:hypothetical protein TNCT_245341 [Trichonephila clavata]|uniref:Uncharacterized protein n=1 Tax=Trichonephila clavata TaxID=2740835 RepID=A0A8X6LSQ9_TRICU|nr:hypothetical protein TNCT_245341 [Trichonephila clavata]
MDGKEFSNEFGTPTERNLEMTFVTLPPFPSIRANAFGNVRNEYRPIAIEEYFRYSQQSIATTCDLPKEDRLKVLELMGYVRSLGLYFRSLMFLPFTEFQNYDIGFP